MAGKITDLTAASTLAGTELLEVVQSATNKKATVAQILAGAQPLFGAQVANVVFAGPASGGAAAATFRPLVTADIPDLSSVYAVAAHNHTGVYQPADATLDALAALDGTAGLLEQTALNTFTSRAIGVANATDILTRGDGDTRFSAAAHNHTGIYEPVLGNPASDGYVLSSTAAGVRSWIAAGGGGYSKLTQSGANNGTLTLYDDTAVTGDSSLVIRGGPGQSANLLSIRNAANVETSVFRGTGEADLGGNFAQYRYGGNAKWLAYGPGSVMALASDFPIVFSSTTGALGTPDIGLARASAGVLKVTDGSSGFGEHQASTFSAQTANGANLAIRTISESITLNTGGTTTDSSANLLPANSYILGVTARITTAITTATDWKLGDGTTAARFTTANSTLTSGTTDTGLLHLQGSVSTDAAGPVQIAAAKLRITTTGTPSAGVVRVTVTYIDFTAPTS